MLVEGKGGWALIGIFSDGELGLQFVGSNAHFCTRDKAIHWADCEAYKNLNDLIYLTY